MINNKWITKFFKSDIMFIAISKTFYWITTNFTLTFWVVHSHVTTPT